MILLVFAIEIQIDASEDLFSLRVRRVRAAQPGTIRAAARELDRVHASLQTMLIPVQLTVYMYVPVRNLDS